jgi:hypothetical protein
MITNLKFGSNWKTLFIAACCLAWVACITDDSRNKTKGPVALGEPTMKVDDPATLTTIQWLDSSLNKGSVVEGTQVEVIFRFKNTGDKPLVIESAQPSCGCTVAEKPEQPILPGAEGRIKAVFNSNGRTGHNHKTLTVRANTKPNASQMVEFNVDVVGKNEGPKAAGNSDVKTF